MIDIHHGETDQPVVRTAAVDGCPHVAIELAPVGELGERIGQCQRRQCVMAGSGGQRRGDKRRQPIHAGIGDGVERALRRTQGDENTLDLTARGDCGGQRGERVTGALQRTAPRLTGVGNPFQLPDRLGIHIDPGAVGVHNDELSLLLAQVEHPLGVEQRSCLTHDGGVKRGRVIDRGEPSAGLQDSLDIGKGQLHVGAGSAARPHDQQHEERADCRPGRGERDHRLDLHDSRRMLHAVHAVHAVYAVRRGHGGNGRRRRRGSGRKGRARRWVRTLGLDNRRQGLRAGGAVAEVRQLLEGGDIGRGGR